MNLEINISTWKGFEETVHLATLKSKSIHVVNLLKESAEIETGMAEKYRWDQANRQKHGLVWRNRIISQIIRDYFYLPFFLLLILWCRLTVPHSIEGCQQEGKEGESVESSASCCCIWRQDNNKIFLFQNNKLAVSPNKKKWKITTKIRWKNKRDWMKTYCLASLRCRPTL